ncbi:TetR/AcrR family transcriptional regulator [Aestuariimicrobium ganziense]|uniref:TetR/AcrR family transcriptional regulator n=1 Tax=Aestuariimicrobium ganziense TaxID=2773677 RepID=UPI0019407D73|nr:TetR/AcrR family transcriptional regulator [Aestuariimicrobium ganziense]
MSTSGVVDGRTTRWAEHNATRRTELVEATLRAIRQHGHNVGMDEIAASAGTSKPVFYRHFGDRAGLYTAVVESVHRFILGNLAEPLSSDADPSSMVADLADAYLAVVEADQEIYRFVANRPAGDSPDPVLGVTNVIGDEISATFARWLEAHGHDTAPANTWGHGVVGFVWAVADRWILTDLRRPRADIVGFVLDLFEPAFAAQITTAPTTTTVAPRETKESLS